MRKSIIASLLSKVNASVNAAELAVDKAVSYQQHRAAEEKLTNTRHMADAVMRLIKAPAMSHEDFRWQFEEGGDTSGKCDSYTALAAVNTAFFACAMAYRRENIIVEDDKRAVADTIHLLGSKLDQAWGTPYDGIAGTEEEVIDPISFEESLYNATVAFFYALHISRFEGNAWMRSFDTKNELGETISHKPLTVLTDYIVRKADTDERFVILKDSAHLKHFVMPDLDIEGVKPAFTAWLYEYTPVHGDEPRPDTRHGRIVERSADNQFLKLVFNIQQGNTRAVENAPWELVLCSPDLNWQRQRFMASVEWQKIEAEEAIVEHGNAVARYQEAKELEALTQQLKETTAKLKELTAKPEEPKAEEEKPKEVTVIQLPTMEKHIEGIVRNNNMPRYNVAGPRG